MERTLKKRKKRYNLLTNKKKKEVTSTPKKRKKETSPRKKKTIYLRNCLDVRVFLSRISNELYNGTLDPGIAGKLAYIQNISMNAMREGDYEKRLKDLEDKLKQVIEERQTGGAWPKVETKGLMNSNLPSVY